MSKTSHPSRSPVGSIIFRVVSEEPQPGTWDPRKQPWQEKRAIGRREPPPWTGGPKRAQPASAGGHLPARRRAVGAPWPRHPSGASRM